MALPNHKKEFLKAVQFTDQEIAAIDQTMDNLAAKAKQEGIVSKEASAPADQTPPAAVPPAPVAAEEPKKPEEQQPVVSPEDQVKEAQALLVKALEPILAPLTQRLDALDARLAQVETPASLTPAAALAAKSITNQPGGHVVKGRNPETGPVETKETEEAPTVTGIKFVDRIIALNQQPVAK